MIAYTLQKILVSQMILILISKLCSKKSSLFKFCLNLITNMHAHIHILDIDIGTKSKFLIYIFRRNRRSLNLITKMHTHLHALTNLYNMIMRWSSMINFLCLVARCTTKITNPDSKDAKYVNNVSEIAKVSPILFHIVLCCNFLFLLLPVQIPHKYANLEKTVSLLFYIF